MKKFITNPMSWKEAVNFMEKGGAVRRKGWRVNDFLYIKEGVLFCDGGFQYLGYLKATNGNWYGIAKDVRDIKAI